jgi:hypothetical protein
MCIKEIRKAIIRIDRMGSRLVRTERIIQNKKGKGKQVGRITTVNHPRATSRITTVNRPRAISRITTANHLRTAGNRWIGLVKTEAEAPVITTIINAQGEVVAVEVMEAVEEVAVEVLEVEGGASL